MEVKSEYVKDMHERTFATKPKPEKLFVYNRAFFFGKSNALTHANDLYDIYSKMEKKPKTIGICTDNGPDYNPNSYLILISYGRLWRDLDLDQLIAVSYAPHNSKYNFIEIAWGNLSLALAQKTLCPEASQMNPKNEEEMTSLFSKALKEQKEIWRAESYAGQEVKAEVVFPHQKDYPYSDYDEIKKVFECKKIDQQYEKEFLFLFRHCYKRPYYLHFRRCLQKECSCMKNIGQKLPNTLDFFKQFGKMLVLPRPILIKTNSDVEHYCSLIDLVSKKETLKYILEEDRKMLGKSRHCKKCYSEFKSLNDFAKHQMFCK